MNIDSRFHGRFIELKHRLRTHPAFLGGPADVNYWLDLLEFCLIILPEGVDTLADLKVDFIDQHSELMPMYVLASYTDPLCYRTLEKYLNRLLKGDQTKVRGLFESAPELVRRWLLSAATGRWKEPRTRGRNKYQYMIRDESIAAAVNGIRDIGDLPYTSENRNSACKVISEWSYSVEVLPYPLAYATVRTIWRNYQSRIRQASRLGLIPTPQKQTRRKKKSLS